MNQQEGLGSQSMEGVWCCGAAPEVLHSVLGSPIEEGHGGAGEGPVEGYQEGERLLGKEVA